MGCITLIAGLGMVFVLAGSNAPWWTYVVLVVVAVVASSSSVEEENPEPKVDLDEIRAAARKEVWEEAKVLKTHLERWEQNLKLREHVLARRSSSRPPEPSADQLAPDSLRGIRNTLMKHHECKGADAEYQASATCRDTNQILQQLNKLIDQNKARVS
jgi:hypothetical protein